jgi:5-methylcytosine-specific restriction enzyme subunit McrC
VVQVEGVTFEILPKADRGGACEDSSLPPRWHGALVEMLTIARHVPVHAGVHGLLELRGHDLLSVFLLLFLDEVERLRRDGLARTYRTEEANEHQFRGRLAMAKHLRENLVHRERFFVAHTVFDADNLPNRILRQALRAVAATAARGEVADRSRRLLADYPEVSPLRVDPAHFDRLPRNRAFARYERALTLARWILDHLVPLPSSGGDPAFVYLVEMAVLFQEFVAVMFRRLAGDELTVRAQARQAFWPAGARWPRGLHPDLVVGTGGARVVIDTKWKTPGREGPTDEDLRQVYVYCDYFGAERGILLYPRTASSPEPWGGGYEGRPRRCELRYLDLFGADGRFDAAGVRSQLAALVGTTLTEGEADGRGRPGTGGRSLTGAP